MSDGATEVGRIVAYLNMDRSEWNRSRQQAKAEAAELSRINPKIQIDVNSAKGLAELAAVKAAANSLENAQVRLGNAQVNLDRARAQSAVLAKKVADAERALASARSAEGATETQIKKAESDLAKARTQAETATRRITTTEQSLTKARRDLDQAGLRALATEQKLAEAADKTGKSLEHQQRNAHLLSTTLITLGPAIVPFLAALAAATGAAVLLGGAAVLAFLGARKAMQDGSAAGQQYAGDLDAIKSVLGTLEKSAASGFLGPFNAATATSVSQLRQLNPEIRNFAAIAGNTAGHALSGLIGGFITLNPLFRQIAVLADHGAASFDQYANGGGLEKFQTFVQGSLPQVIATIESVAGAVGHVGGAIGVLSGPSLTILRLLADVIDRMPTPVIVALASAFIALKAASTGLSVLSGAANGLNAIAKAGKGLGGSGTGLATGLIAAGGAAGIATLAVTGLSLALQENAKAHQENVQYVDAFTQALQQSKGAIDDNVRSTAADILVKNGWIDAAKKVGLSASTVTDAALGNKDALDQVTEAFRKSGTVMSPFPGLIRNLADKLAYAQQQYKDFTDAASENNKALAAANPALAKQSAELGITISQLITAKQAQKDKAAADAAALAILALAHPEYQRVAAELHVAGSAYLTAKDAADQQAKSTAESTLQMRLAGDTAGLLKAQLDGLAGKALSLGESQTRVAQAVDAATVALKANGKTVDLNTAKGQANRSNIEQIAEANRQLVTTQLQGVKSSGQANRIIDQANAAFLTNVTRIYGANSAAAAYAKTVGLIPHVSSTDPKFNDADALTKIANLTAQINNIKQGKVPGVDADTAAGKKKIAELQAQIDALNGTVQIQINENISANRGANAAGQIGIKHAAGGTIGGHGGPKADDQLAWVSTGEEIIQEPYASKYRLILKAINAGKYASGGTVGEIGTTHRGSKKYWTYNGILYSTQASAENARTRAEQKDAKKQATPHDVNKSGFNGEVKAVIAGVRGEIPHAAQVGRDLSAAMNATFKLKGMKAEVTSARATLADLIKTANQFGSDVTSSLRQGFNPTTLGTSSGGILAAINAQTKKATGVGSDVSALGKVGFNKDYISQLASSGGGATLDALAGLASTSGGRTQLAQISKAFASYQTATSLAGKVSENTVYGKAVRDQQKQVSQLVASEKSQQTRIDSLTRAIVRLTGRPVQLSLDGKIIERYVAADVAKLLKR